MRYVFDSSSIIGAIIEDKISILAGNYTLDLACYELGNIIWKRRVITRDLRDDEVEKILEIIKRTLNLMEIISIRCHEADIAKISESLNLTFYDSSYIFAAKRMDIPLITEDIEIKNKAHDYIKILSLKDLI